MRVRRLVLLAVGVLLAVALWRWAPPVLGNYLVDSEPPRKADAIFVLAGDFSGQRILTAAKLARERYAPLVYVSGPAGMYGFHESEFAISYARDHGYPEISFVPLPNDCKSTRDEAQQFMPRFRQLGYRTVLVVTSNYHTRRAGRTIRRYADGLDIQMIAAPSPDYHPADWWRRRQDQKTFFLEWSKTVASWIGL